MRAVLRSNPRATPELVRRTRELMDAHALDGRVTGYENLAAGLHLPDPNDRHVSAAAIVAGADVIVTWNLKHFPPAALAPYGTQVQNPDGFIVRQFHIDPQAVRGSARRIRARLKKPP